jgi:hypothetical protein
MSASAAEDASAQGMPRCAVSTWPAREIAGLPRSVVIGRQDRFHLAPTGSDADVLGRVRWSMVGFGGRRFFSGTAPAWRWLGVVFALGDRGARITASYTQVGRSGRACTQRLTRRVRAKQRIFFPSRCFNRRQRPRAVIIACGDGNFQLRSMRWNRWNHRRTRGRGIAYVNDCDPYCAVGTFHRVPVRASLSRPRRCRNVQRYMYTRVRWRYERKPSWIERSSGRTRFPCRLYDFA